MRSLSLQEIEFVAGGGQVPPDPLPPDSGNPLYADRNAWGQTGRDIGSDAGGVASALGCDAAGATAAASGACGVAGGIVGRSLGQTIGESAADAYNALIDAGTYVSDVLTSVSVPDPHPPLAPPSP